MTAAIRASIVSPTASRRPGARIQILAHEVAILRALATKGTK